VQPGSPMLSDMRYLWRAGLQAGLTASNKCFDGGNLLQFEKLVA